MKKITVIFAALLFFLLPLKFGGLAVMPESGGFYPENYLDWLFITFPPHAIGFAGAILLLMAAISYREKLDFRQLIFTVSWSILPSLAVLPGIIRGDAVIALGELSLLLGCGAIIAAASLILNQEPDRAMLLTGAIFFGGIVTACYGWNQHLYSLDEMRNFVAEQEAKGIPVSEGMRLKLTDPRIYSTLASSNTLASLLMIMSVMGVYFSGYWSRMITPPRQAKYIMRILFLLLFVSVLLLTRSRSMIFCPVIAGVLALFSTGKIKWKWRLAGLVAGVILLIAGIIVAAAAGRGVASMGERADYLRTSTVLCAEYPLTGSGWGGFFRTHMKIKFSDVQETARDPHNVVALFASQCGIPAGLIMLWVLLCPLIFLWKHRFEKNLCGAVFWCGVIFTLHSLIDCDWQIPALIVIMGVLYTAALAQLPEKKYAKIPSWVITAAAIIISVGAWATTLWYIAGDVAITNLQDKVNPASLEMAQKYEAYPVEFLAEKAKKYRPDQAVIPIFCGDWYFRLGDLDRAENFFREAEKLDPARPSTYMRLARISMLRGKREEAQKYLDHAGKLFPKSNKYTMEKLCKELKI